MRKIHRDNVVREITSTDRVKTKSTDRVLSILTTVPPVAGAVVELVEINIPRKPKDSLNYLR